MNPWTRIGALALVLWIAAPQCRAQIEGADEIRKILEKVEEELAEIDKLLRETGGGAAARESAEQIRQALEQTGGRSQTVQEEIQKLIEQLEQMSSQQSGGGGGQQQDQQDQQQPQEGQQQRPQRNRQENPTPDFVPQGQQPQQGQQQQQGQQPQGQEPRGGQPQGGQETPDPGQNRQGQNPPENQTGPGQQASGADSWGELQPYVNFLKNRGVETKVPEKFRKFYEAYIRSQRKKQ